MSQVTHTKNQPQGKPAHVLNAEIKFEINEHKVNINRSVFKKGIMDTEDLADAKKEWKKSRNTVAVKQCREEILQSIVANEKTCKFNVSLIVN